VLRMTREGLASPWLGAAIACLAPVAFFANVFRAASARTSRNLYGTLLIGVIGTVVAFVLGRGPSAAGWLAFAIGVVGHLLYVFWYSRFAPAGKQIVEGAVLPELSFVENGTTVSSALLLAKPALWIFYRGNWCPLCVAQVKEIAAQYRELARRGIEVFLVSPQPERNTVALSARFDAPMRFLTDPGNRAADALGILVRGGLPAGLQALGYGSDVPRPTVFITSAGGRVLWRDITDNYRVRPEPATLFNVLDRLLPTRT
jgi:peroxiredoxin